MAEELSIAKQRSAQRKKHLEDRQLHKDQRLHDLKKERKDILIQKNLKTANKEFDKQGAKANQLPFTATVIIHFNEGPKSPRHPDPDKPDQGCIGSVIHQVNSDKLHATYILTAGHCCFDEAKDPPTRNHHFRVSWSVNEVIIKPNPTKFKAHYNLQQTDPFIFAGNAQRLDIPTWRTDWAYISNDWCIIGFEGVENAGKAPAQLHIMYDDTQKLPPGNELLLSTYWEHDMSPPNPENGDYLKKFAYVRPNLQSEHSIISDEFEVGVLQSGKETKQQIKDVKQGIWKLKAEYTAHGMSGSPLVATDGVYKNKYIRATVSFGVWIDLLCRIDRDSFDGIVRAINDHLLHSEVNSKFQIPIHHDGAKGYTGPKIPPSAHTSSFGMTYHDDSYSLDDDTVLDEYGYGFNHNLHHGQRGTISDRYYHEYGAYDQNNYNEDYLLLFAMGTLILIGICCLVIIISIICGFVAGKFYEIKKTQNEQSKSNQNAFDVENVNLNQI